MAVEMFLDLDTVPGESVVKGFEAKIDIFSYSLGASNPSSVATGAGSGAGKVDISSMSIQKVVDKATPKLFQACCKGSHFAKAKLTVREAGGDKPVEYLVLDFTQVFVDSVSWGGAAGGGKPSESVAFSFATINITYMIQTAKGGSEKGGDAYWNVQGNTPDQ